MVVELVNGRNNIRAPHLQHLLIEIHNMKGQIGRISCAHIYRELNEEAYTLSKQALAFHPGMMEIEEVSNGLTTLHYEAI